MEARVQADSGENKRRSVTKAGTGEPVPHNENIYPADAQKVQCGTRGASKRENLRGTEAPTQGRQCNVIMCTEATEHPMLCGRPEGPVQSELTHPAGSAGLDAYAA